MQSNPSLIEKDTNFTVGQWFRRIRR